MPKPKPDTCPLCRKKTRSLMEHSLTCEKLAPLDPPPPDLPPIPGRLTPDEAAREVLAETVAWADAYGRTKLIAEAMTTLAGQPISRQMVGRWLNGTATPNLGTGLLLLAVVRQLQQPSPLPAGQRVLLTISLTPTQS